MLKPDVVFFGENVPKPRVARCYAAVDASTAAATRCWCSGSSLTVMSGCGSSGTRTKRGMPVVIVNRGATRGDDLASYKVDLGTTPFLTELSVGHPAIAG